MILTKLSILILVPRGPVIEYAKLDGLDTAYIGTTVNITCKIQGFDGVIGYFLKNDIMVMEDDELQKYEYFKPRVIVTPPNYVFHLEIKNVTMEDAGNYTCKASKYGLKSKKTFLLEVGMVNDSFLHLLRFFFTQYHLLCVVMYHLLIFMNPQSYSASLQKYMSAK